MSNFRNDRVTDETEALYTVDTNRRQTFIQNIKLNKSCVTFEVYSNRKTVIQNRQAISQPPQRSRVNNALTDKTAL